MPSGAARETILTGRGAVAVTVTATDGLTADAPPTWVARADLGAWAVTTCASDRARALELVRRLVDRWPAAVPAPAAGRADPLGVGSGGAGWTACPGRLVSGRSAWR